MRFLMLLVMAIPFQADAATIYLCKAYNGGAFWANAYCGQYKAHVDRIAEVPDGLPFSQQVAIAEQQKSAAAVTMTKQIAPMPLQASSLSGSNANACALLDKQIQDIDDTARRPQSAATQQRLRDDRRAAISRRNELRCR